MDGEELNNQNPPWVICLDYGTCLLRWHSWGFQCIVKSHTGYQNSSVGLVFKCIFIYVYIYIRELDIYVYNIYEVIYIQYSVSILITYIYIYIYALPGAPSTLAAQMGDHQHPLVPLLGTSPIARCLVPILQRFPWVTDRCRRGLSSLWIIGSCHNHHRGSSHAAWLGRLGLDQSKMVAIEEGAARGTGHVHKDSGTCWITSFHK